MYKLKVFLTEESKIELEDDYIDKEDELHKFMFDQLKSLAKTAKMILRNKQFMVNLKQYDDGTPHTDTIKLKNFKLEKYKIKHDDDWIPENLDVSDCKPYTIKVGPKTMDRLETYTQVYQARIKIYNDSLSDGEKKIAGKKADLAVCFEQIIHEALINEVLKKLSALDDKEFDEEFEEINDKDKAKRKSRTGKKRITND